MSESTRASVSIPPAFLPSKTMSLGHFTPGATGTKRDTSSQIVTPIQSVNVCIRSGSILGRKAKLEYRLPFASLCHTRPNRPLPRVCLCANTAKGAARPAASWRAHSSFVLSTSSMKIVVNPFLRTLS
jgi:hypothetical protein